MLAKREGQIIPEDSKEIWKRCFPNQDDDNSYVARMSQAEWLFAQVSEDVVLAIIKFCLRELFHMFGFIANTGKTIKSHDTHTFAKADGTTYQSEVLVPGPFSHANAVVALVQGRDMLAHYKQQKVSRESFLKCMPKPVAGFLSEEGIKQIMQFLGIDEGSDSAFLEYIGKHGGDAVQNAPKYRGCHLPDPSRDLVVKIDGSVDLEAYRQLPKALSCYAKLSKHSAEASNTQTTSKPIEGGFSPLTANARVRGPAEMPLMSGIMQMDNYNKSGINIRSVEEHIHWKGADVVAKPGWKGWYYARDDKKGFEMRMTVMQNNLPKRAKNGGVYKYKTPNHGGQARTNKWSQVRPDSNTPEGRRLKKRMETIRERMKRGSGFEFRGVEGQGAAATETAPAVKRKRVNDAAKNRAMEKLNSVTSARRRAGKRPADDESMSNNPSARAEAAGSTAGLARSSKKGRPSSSDDPDFSVGEGEFTATGLARRSARTRPDVNYSGMQADPDAGEATLSQADNAGGSAEVVTAGLNTEVVCAVEVGARVEVFWGESWGWSPGIVTAISNGKLQHPTNADEFVVKGYAIVQYEKSAKTQATKFVHNLGRESCFDTVGEQKFAWRELSDSERVGEAGTSSVVGPPERTSCSTGLKPGRAHRASSEHDTGAQGGEPSISADSSSSEESDESDESDESQKADDPRPSQSRRAGKSKAKEQAPVAVTCAVEVRSRVEVRWKDSQGRWSPCTVLQISTGRTRNPRCRGEYVVKGYAIVEYQRGWKCHHNLDSEHHVSRFGDREWAWRELEVSATKPDASAGAKRAACSKSGAKPEVPINNDGKIVSDGCSCDKGASSGTSAASRDAVGPAVPSDRAEASSTSVTARTESGGAVSGSPASVAEPVPSPWSLLFCEKYYFPQRRIKRSHAAFDQGTYEVTRASVAGAQKPNTVKFSVVGGSGRMFYIAHLQETGPIMVSVKKVFPPCEEDWSETLQCYRVYTSRAALTRALSPVDTLSDKGEIEALGRSSLLAQARKDEKSGLQTYHCGDTSYWVDVRHVVGVVRWAPMVYRPADPDSLPDFSDNYWSGCPEGADIIYVGQHFSQVK
jgi:hypothetical protein